MVMYHDHMNRKMTATDVKARLLAVLDDVASGQTVEITKRGKVVAQLTPVRTADALRNALRGSAATAATDEELFTTGLDWESQ